MLGGWPADRHRAAIPRVVPLGMQLEQAARVRVVRRGEQRGRVGLLDDAAGVHRQHAVGDLGDDAEVVGDEHDGRAVVALEAGEQVEQLRLHGDVERGRRLVGDQQLGAQRQRHRQHHPLAHAAGELVRVVVDPAGGVGDADLLEQGDRPLLGGLGAAPDRWARIASTICQPDGELRVQARQRVLEDHRDRAPRMRCICAAGSDEQVGAVEADRTADPRRRARAAGSACAVTDLPEPDSPTMPTVSPAATSKDTPRTAWTSPSSVGNVTRRSSTDSSVARRHRPSPPRATN